MNEFSILERSICLFGAIIFDLLDIEIYPAQKTVETTETENIQKEDKHE